MEERALMMPADGGEPMADVPGRNLSLSAQHMAELDKMELDGDLTGQSYIDLKGHGGMVWGTESDLDENAYGAAAVAIIRDIPKLIMQLQDSAPWSLLSLTLTRLAYSVGIMIANLIIQGAILWYIYIWVVQPAVRNVQVAYHDFRTENFDDDGHLLEDVWLDYEGKAAVCQITMSNRAFYFGILLLWALLMMTELRSVERVARDIWNVKSVTKTSEMLEFVTTNDVELGGKCLVVGLTKSVRIMVLSFVCLPRAIIGFSLLYLGCQWLSASASFADMTLNAMALEFVKNIDEILYNAVLPRRLQIQIADTNVFRIEKRKTKRDLDNEEWGGYRRTLKWIVFMAVFLAVFGQVAQTVLPFDLSELNSLCSDQVKESQSPLCDRPTWGDMSVECYPYSGHQVGRTERAPRPR